MDLGRAIAQLRKKQCLNQKSLARKCSISQTYLSQIENNRKDPNLSTLKEISRALEVPLPILFFLAMNDGDIPEGKREAFGQLLGPIKAMVHEVFITVAREDHGNGSISAGTANGRSNGSETVDSEPVDRVSRPAG